MLANLSAEGLGLGKNTQRISLPTGSLPWQLPKSLHGSGAHGFKGRWFQRPTVSGGHGFKGRWFQGPMPLKVPVL